MNSFPDFYAGRTVSYSGDVQISNLYLMKQQKPGDLRRCSDWLQTGRSGDRIPLEARFSAPVQTSPESHTASYAMVTGSFPWVKRPGRGVDHPSPSSAEVIERVELYLYST